MSVHGEGSQEPHQRDRHTPGHTNQLRCCPLLLFGVTVTLLYSAPPPRPWAGETWCELRPRPQERQEQNPLIRDKAVPTAKLCEATRKEQREVHMGCRGRDGAQPARRFASHGRQ